MRNATTLRREVVADAGAFAEVAARFRGSVAQALFGGSQLLMGRYRLGERLGAGGQGTVWRAFDERLRRDVAVKVSSRAGIIDAVAEGGDRWIRHEARMLGRVSHPNVVGVFDVGFHSASAFGAGSDGVVLLAVLEFVRGETLATWLHRRDRSVADIAAVFGAVADGLAAVHDAGLVHCDVKPGNILISHDGIAKLGDFGLAHTEQRWQTQRADHDPVVTASVARSVGASTSLRPAGGTPLYMAPEQFGTAALTAAADQYALAATWFEALFGRLPHHYRSAVELHDAKLAGAPLRPSARISAHVYAVLARALDPDPARRHANVRAFASAMRRRGPGVGGVLAGAALAVGLVAVAAASEPTPAGCDPEALRRPEPLTAEFDGDASRSVVYLGGRVVDRWNARRAASVEARRSLCATPRPDPAALACITRLETTAEVLVQPENIRSRATAERALSVIEVLPAPAECLVDQGLVGADLELEALEPALRTISDAASVGVEHVKDGLPLEALSVLDPLVSDRLASPVFDAEIGLARAQAFLQLGRFDAARSAYQAVWDLGLARHAPLDAARAAAGMAYVVGSELADPEGGLTWVRHGRAQLERFGDAPATAADLAASAAAVLAARGDFAGALVECERAIELLTPLADETQARMTLIENAAALQDELGDDATAEQRLREVLAWREAQLGPNHRSVGEVLRKLAHVDQARGDLGAASASLDRALSIQAAAEAPDELEIAAIESARAGIATARGDVELALRSIARVDELRRRHLPPDHPLMAAAIVMRLDALVSAGRVDDAHALAHDRKDELAVLIEDDSDRALDLESLLVIIAGAKGRTAEALTRLVHLVEAAERRGTRNASLALWSAQAAALIFNTGDFERAAAWTKRTEGYAATIGAEPEALAILERVHRGLDDVSR